MRIRQCIFLLVAPMFLLLCCIQVNANAQERKKIEWVAVLVNGKKMGHMKQTRTVNDDTVVTVQELSLEVKRGDIPPMEIKSRMETSETIDGLPLAFKFEQSGPGSFVKSQGVITRDGKLRVKLGTAGQDEKEMTLDWPEGAVMEEGSRLLAVKMGLREGTTYQFKQFMPDSLRALDVSVSVGKTANVDLLGRVVPLTAVQQTLRTQGESLSIESYVDERLNFQKMIMPMMGMKMEMIACTEQYALSENDPADFFGTVLISSPRVLSRAELEKPISYGITPKVGNDDFSIPSSDEQEVVKSQTQPGAVTVKVRKVEAKRGVRFPYEGTDEVALKAMKPTNWVQSDAREIIALAKQAVGDSKDSSEAISRIQDFVTTYINKKDLSVGYASALEVVKGREGDCTEHAVLAAALCKAVGIPARVATGVAYARKFSGRKNIFVPHAWTQAYIGGKWISIDAALGGFDSGHIALSYGNGDPFYFFSLMNTLGNFNITNLKVFKAGS